MFTATRFDAITCKTPVFRQHVPFSSKSYWRRSQILQTHTYVAASARDMTLPATLYMQYACLCCHSVRRSIRTARFAWTSYRYDGGSFSAFLLIACPLVFDR